MKLNINGKDHDLEGVSSSTPLLWAIRDSVGLTGTKFGCGVAQCGACTVLVDGEPTRSCILPVQLVAGKKITTVEGLSEEGTHAVQQAWAELNVPQCGYCQSGQMITTTALLSKNSNPSDDDIDEALSGNICRCGTYSRIRAAVKRAAELKR